MKMKHKSSIFSYKKLNEAFKTDSPKLPFLPQLTSKIVKFPNFNSEQKGKDLIISPKNMNEKYTNFINFTSAKKFKFTRHRNNVPTYSEIYKDIFGSETGKAVSKLNRSISKPKIVSSNTFLTTYNNITFDQNHNTPIKWQGNENQNGDSPMNLKLKNNLFLSIDKLFQEAKDSDNISIMKRLKLFATTGEKKYLFYCPSCLHCRRNEGEIFDSKFRIRNIALKNEPLLIEDLPVLENEIFIKKFNEFIKEESKKPDKKSDFNVFIQVIEDLLSGNLKLEQLLTQSNLEKLKSHAISIGRSNDSDIAKFCQGLSETPTSLFKYPLEKETKEYHDLYNDIYNKYFEKYLIQKKQLHLKEALYKKKNIKEMNIYSNNNCSILEIFFNFKLNKYKEEKINSEVDLKPLIIFIGLHESIKQVSLQNKDLGMEILKLFKDYFNENEKSWFKILGSYFKIIENLKQEIELLSFQFLKETHEIDGIMKDKSISLQNLIEHKRLITKLIGINNFEKTTRMEIESDKKIEDTLINKWISDWNLIKKSESLSIKLKELDEKVIEQRINSNSEYITARPDERAILKNAEKFLMILPYKSRWQQEVETMKKEFNALSKNSEITVSKLSAIDNKNRQISIKSNLLQNDLNFTRKAYNETFNLLKTIPKIVVATQTDVDMNDLDFIKQSGLIKEKKDENAVEEILKIIKKVALKLSKSKMASPQITYSIMESTIYSSLKKIETKIFYEWKFEEIFYDTVVAKYGFEAKKRSEEILNSIQSLSKSDEKIGLFGDFLGLGEKKYEPRIIYLFCIIIKISNIQIIEAFKPDSTLQLTLSQATNFLLKSLINISPTLYTALRTLLIVESSFYLNGNLQRDLTNQQKNFYHLIYSLKDSPKFSSDINDLFSNNSKSTNESNIIEINFLKKLVKEKVDRMIDDDVIENIFKNYFEQNISYSGFMTKSEFEAATFHKIEIKILFFDFLKVGVRLSELYTTEMSKAIKDICYNIKSSKDENLSYDGLTKFLQKFETKIPKWKIIAIENLLSPEKKPVNIEKMITIALSNPLFSCVHLV